ncbi:MAG: C25 family cysteine peptidase [Patescibacteria group bacterium]
MRFKKMRTSVFALVCMCVLAVNVKAEQLTVELTSETYEIINLPDGSHEIRMANFGNILTPGKPMLPSKTFLIAVPPGAKINSINIVGLEQELLNGKYSIVPAPMMLPMDGDQALSDEALRVYRENKNSAYSTDAFYPQQAIVWDGEGSYRQFQFARVNFAPFSYNAVTQQLVYYENAVVTIDYTTVTAKQKSSPLKQNFAQSLTGRNASVLLYNYEEAIPWYQKYFEPNSNSSYYDYVIITTDALQSTLSSFVSWKQSVGYSVNVVTVTWINSNYSGSDLPQKIRNFLIDKYTEWGIEYVLLVGDVANVPMRMCSPKADTTSGDTPTDYYYADLTGNWDSDGDSRYGEYGQDSVDWVPEVMVGRIPWSDASTVSQICTKLINFESNRGTWKKNALLLGAMNNYQNEDNRGYAKTDGATLMEIHKLLIQNISGSYTTMYEKTGLSASTYSCTKPLTHTNIINDWSAGQYGMVNWWGHGSKRSAYRKWWSTDDGDNIPENSAGEIRWEAMVSTNDCGSLSNTYSPIIFACSCDNGWPESTNLGKEMIKRGSSGIVASSRLSWCSIGWSHQNHGGNASIDYYFFYYLINHDDKVGDALFNSKVYYSTHFMYSSWGFVCWQNMFDFNLYGDPSLYRSGVETPPVPVGLASFDAIVEKSAVKLIWATATESNNYGFEVQRKTAGNEMFQQIGFVPGNGTSGMANFYEYIDNQLSQKHYYYRLKQIDLDGKFEYSPILEVTLDMPSVFQLRQNYPNPFNPETNIEYQLPQQCRVKLVVYNMLGQEIRTLLNKQQEAGYFQIRWDGLDEQGHKVPSGIYLYKFEAGEYVRIKKMLMTK